MTRRILVIASYGAAIAAALSGSSGLAVVAPPVSQRRAREFDYPATAKSYDPPNDVRQLRREQYARERRTRPVLAKGKGRI